ncbi:MAG TPA: hypothetical protein VEG34_06105 [Thermoanaerobaculia bacterium]|nr:hypothetical protein [Thermoanaerobaculia bacterium]
MSSGDLPSYELYRLQLEEQLRRNFELLYQAHLVQLRAYETVARARGEIDASLPPLALTLNLPGFPAAPAAPALPPPPAVPALPAPLPSAAPAPTVPAGRARPAKRKRDPNNHLYDAVLDALGRLGDPFTKKDLCRVLGFKPSRTTLHSVLEELVKEGTLRLAADTECGTSNRYSKAQTPPADAAPQG